ncbi:hypothetical protein CCYN2B_90013 [Capnocytophaga cynodegmi]|uniref:Uncharacterized protein n=1 Tax=Capnocytophaga cynodegmi TaxID=28189 RepID=A0A0B7HL19_9FLAO|nr:hypothetical protein CCYN2B_90013 [Capnocytophaga cynodegmi]
MLQTSKLNYLRLIHKVINHCFLKTSLVLHFYIEEVTYNYKL